MTSTVVGSTITCPQLAGAGQHSATRWYSLALTGTHWRSLVYMLITKCCAGNLETLLTAPTKAGIDVRAAVADWHARHYSANLMTAAVYGRHSLDELQQLAAEAFSGVANTGLAAPQFSEDLYTDEVR